MSARAGSSKAPGNRRRIAVVAPVLRPRDAVSLDAVLGTAAMAQLGWDVALFADDAAGTDASARAIRDASRHAGSPQDVLLFHQSFGWSDTLGLLRASSARKLVKYHNTTPPEFFVGHSEAHVTACAAGRAQVAEIVACGIDGVIADSEYNALEYVAAGLSAERTRVAPPLAMTEELLVEPADMAMLDRLCDGMINVLAVGRVAPNKNHGLAIRSLAMLRNELGREARLVCVGKHDGRLASYSTALRGLAEELEVAAHVLWLDDASPAVLKAAFIAADVLLVTSMHEGFCVPVSEAMALGVPVVALDRAAVGETLGTAGVLLSEAEPLAFALAVDMLRGDRAARAAMVRAGRERFATQYARRVAALRLVNAIESLAAR